MISTGRRRTAITYNSLNRPEAGSEIGEIFYSVPQLQKANNRLKAVGDFGHCYIWDGTVMELSGTSVVLTAVPSAPNLLFLPIELLPSASELEGALEAIANDLSDLRLGK